jgi:hypothetical protein
MILKIKPSSGPWAVTIASLESLEYQIQDSDKEGMLKRWEFGFELLKRRVKYKGRDVVPAELMKLIIEKCKISKRELNYRIQCATRYETKKLMCNAVAHYPSWHQMVNEGLIGKKRPPKPSKKPVQSMAWLPRVKERVAEEVTKAQAEHVILTNEQIKDVQDLLKSLSQLLGQSNRIYDVNSERKIS